MLHQIGDNLDIITFKQDNSAEEDKTRVRATERPYLNQEGLTDQVYPPSWLSQVHKVPRVVLHQIGDNLDIIRTSIGLKRLYKAVVRVQQFFAV